MTIPPDLEAQILRYYHVEKWRVGTIARQLHVHHGTVARVLAQAGLPRIGPPARRSQVEPYLPFIHQTLEKFPTLTASRLYAMVCERGYRGSGDHFRHLIACHRPRPAAEAYLRLRSLPGEQGQVDWGHFGHLMIGHEVFSYHSCKNRSCPKCHTKQAKDWLDARKAEILPTDYFHVTITVPQELRALLRANQRDGAL